MVDQDPVTMSRRAKSRLPDEALETSRLLVEFLHAAYATRNVDTGEAVVPAPGTAPTDLSPHAVRAAIHVYQHGERTVGQLASGLGISYGWASRVVEELRAAHYIIRERDVDDRRVVRVRLDPEALEDVERAFHWRSPAVEEALEPLGQPEREAVRIFLRRLTELLRAASPNGPKAPRPRAGTIRTWVAVAPGEAR